MMDYITINNKDYKRVNKRVARRLYNEGVTLLVYSIRANPYSPWIFPYIINNNDSSPFDGKISEFEYYNCRDGMGTYSKYYILDNGN